MASNFSVVGRFGQGCDFCGAHDAPTITFDEIAESLGNATAAAKRLRGILFSQFKTGVSKTMRLLLFGIVAASFTAFSSSSVAAAQTQYFEARMRSDTLSAFWGQPVAIEAHVLLPDSYYKEPTRHYPVMYWIQGFDGYGDPDLTETLAWQRPMRALHEEFILVFLDGMFNGGHQEFANSANNGPWGTALTTEFIPRTETYFRAINKASARFVAGHSSGGWSALWLQVTYPDTFGGEWSISPDPVDFRDFLGVNLTAARRLTFLESLITSMASPFECLRARLAGNNDSLPPSTRCLVRGASMESRSRCLT